MEMPQVRKIWRAKRRASLFGVYLILTGCAAVDRSQNPDSGVPDSGEKEEESLQGQNQLDQIARLHGFDPKNSQPNNSENEKGDQEALLNSGSPQGGSSGKSAQAAGGTPEGRIAELENRVDSLEQLLKSMNEKFRLQVTSGKILDGPFPVDAGIQAKDDSSKAGSTKDLHSATDKSITGIRGEEVQNGTINGFINNESIQTFRRAMVLFRAKRYSDAVIIFTEFVDQNPDHPLAAAAQFLIGECYYFSHEPRLAFAEFQKSILAYEKGSHLSHSLARLAELAQHFGELDKAALYKQQLLSQFPASPANQLTKSSKIPAVIPLGSPEESSEKTVKRGEDEKLTGQPLNSPNQNAQEENSEHKNE